MMEEDVDVPHAADTQGLRDGGLGPAELRGQLYSQLKSSGVLGNVKSQLRAQILGQLQRGSVVQLGPPPGDAPNLKRRALNQMIAQYLESARYAYSLAVYREEAGLGDGAPPMGDDDMLDVLKVERGSLLHTAIEAAKAEGHPAGCLLLHIMHALSQLSQGVAPEGAAESGTQTLGGERYVTENRLQQLEHQYQARLAADRLRPSAGLEERLAAYRQEVEEQSKAEVARQVERFREVELASMRLEESLKFRSQMAAERQELDRMHSDRLSKLRAREEEMMDKLRRQQRDVESIAYEHRQKILKEEERMRTLKAELTQQQDARQDQLRNVERALELREKAVAAREMHAEARLASAAESVADATSKARMEVEREYVELKSTLNNQRMQLEMDRARIMELRSEAAAELAASRAKEDRLRALEASRTEAEARAAAHAADAEIMRLQLERLSQELSQAREELSRRVADATDTADAMLSSAAGAMGLLDAEAAAARGTVAQLREAQRELDKARDCEAEARKDADAAFAARADAEERASRSAAALAALQARSRELEALLDEAIEARQECLCQLEEANLLGAQLSAELAEVREQGRVAKEEARTLRMTMALGPSAGAMAMAGSASLRMSTPADARAASGPYAAAAHYVHPTVLSPARSTATGSGLAISHGRPTVSSPTITTTTWTAAAVDAPTAAWMPGRTPSAELAQSPEAQRLAALSVQEREVASQLASFRQRVAHQREAGAAEMGTLLTRVKSIDGSVPSTQPAPGAATAAAALVPPASVADAATAAHVPSASAAEAVGVPAVHASIMPAARVDLGPAGTSAAGARGTVAAAAALAGASAAGLATAPASATAGSAGLSLSFDSMGAQPHAHTGPPPPTPAPTPEAAPSPPPGLTLVGSLATPPPGNDAAVPVAVASQQPPAPAPVQPPPGLTMVGGNAARAPAAQPSTLALQPNTPPSPAPAPATIAASTAAPTPASGGTPPPPGIVMVSSFGKPAGSTSGGGSAAASRAAAPEPAPAPADPPRTFVSPSSVQDVQAAREAKLALLKEQQAARLAAQAAAEPDPPPPPTEPEPSVRSADDDDAGSAAGGSDELREALGGRSLRGMDSAASRAPAAASLRASRAERTLASSGEIGDGESDAVLEAPGGSSGGGGGGGGDSYDDDLDDLPDYDIDVGGDGASEVVEEDVMSMHASSVSSGGSVF